MAYTSRGIGRRAFAFTANYYKITRLQIGPNRGAAVPEPNSRLHGHLNHQHPKDDETKPISEADQHGDRLANSAEFWRILESVTDTGLLKNALHYVAACVRISWRCYKAGGCDRPVEPRAICKEVTLTLRSSKYAARQCNQDREPIRV